MPKERRTLVTLKQPNHSSTDPHRKTKPPQDPNLLTNAELKELNPLAKLLASLSPGAKEGSIRARLQAMVAAATETSMTNVFSDELFLRSVVDSDADGGQGGEEFIDADELKIFVPGGVHYDPQASSSSGWLSFLFSWTSSSSSSSSTSSSLPAFNEGTLPVLESVAPRPRLRPYLASSSTSTTTTSTSTSASTSSSLSQWGTAIWQGVGIAAIYAALMSFLRVVLRRMFPLHQASLDKWLNRIDYIVGAIGLVALLTSFTVVVATAGFSGLPLMIVVALASFLTAWAVGFLSERFFRFVMELVDRLRRFTADLLRWSGCCPEGLIEFIWQSYKSATRLRVGKCTSCGKRPRDTLNPICGHSVYCQDCIWQKTHCDCGKELAKECFVLVDRQTVGEGPYCACGECIPMALCGACSQRPCSVLQRFRNGRMSKRCNDRECKDSAAVQRWEVAHRRDCCGE
ncbi:hypothetical protein QOT17_013733 [Balamuthia mandrillaris]